MTEDTPMKYLKIESNQAFYSLDGTEWNSIDAINKEDLLKLLDIAISENFEMDEFDKDKLANQAHQIIYQNISEKFSDLIQQKNRFKDESDALFKDAIEKYQQA